MTWGAAMIRVFLSVALGGILKGATGAGDPLIVIPTIALFNPNGVQCAVTIFVLPSLLSNYWQCWAYRHDLLTGPVVLIMSGTGGLSVTAGSRMLAALEPRYLSRIVAIGVIINVTLRALKVVLDIGERAATTLARPSVSAQVYFKAVRVISAPITITFLNAMRLPRATFIATVSIRTYHLRVGLAGEKVTALYLFPPPPLNYPSMAMISDDSKKM